MHANIDYNSIKHCNFLLEIGINYRKSVTDFSAPPERKKRPPQSGAAICVSGERKA